MPGKGNKLTKIGKDIFKLEADNPKRKCLQRLDFSQFCFDESEERAAAIDLTGYFHFLLLINNDWIVKKFSNVGQSTFVAFNPIDQCEVIIGLASTDLKIVKLKQVFNDAESIEDFYELKGHQLPPTRISFFKSYCFSVSRSEAIIWDLKSFAKLHQLRLEPGEGGIRKGLLSPTGLITAIYENDTLQVWPFEQFDLVNKISLSEYGLNNTKDIIFTENGRAALICGGKNKIIIFNTKTWSVIKNFEFSEHFSGIKRLQIVPLPLDAGSNKIISVLFDDGTFKFFDINLKSFIEVTDHVAQGVRKLSVSPHGQWVGFIQYDGSLVISCFDQLMKLTAEVTKIKPTVNSASLKVKTHTIDQHLKHVERNIKDNLRLERLLPILKEYGEYPERYRPIIWRTILKLPSNKKAFIGIISKVPTDSTIKMLDDYKLADRTKTSVLALTVDRLVQFCPMFSQSLFIPEFIFPFIIVFKKDHLLAYEAVLTIILNYCQKWFEYHPFPPLNILGIIENILAETDPVLLKFYYDRDITSTTYAWPLLQTAMSEVLTGNEWLILWDHLLSFRKPTLLLICVVAYNICSRRTILSFMKKERIEEFFRQPGKISVKDVIKVALRIDGEISDRNHPAQYLKDTFCKLPPDGPYPTFLCEEYPKFIVEDREKMNELINLKDEEFNLRKKRQQISEIAEQKRLNDEKESFIKQIQEQRLREQRRCYDEQFRVSEAFVANERQKLYRQMLLSGSTDVTRVHSVSNKSSSRSKIKSYHELKDDVDTLEEEIRQFLRIIKRKR
ncbi:GSCOCG00007142001-RA-CDS [Cotesia congregata]|uniref:Similar to TBC1D31: TBC1 domain family member 31 (Bos taurus) n=1 Tax=Cotesia congregata TaxID=51543 RepID=A0A8J2HBE2_COTCN|nr:GSCOCG00007142001-RA-CDS [Cotesia congregata]CAG5092879.1 Similar to TBC1D31: TBC1 domain family member 31 (Bos taurus) [Cotesia congregata]